MFLLGAFSDDDDFPNQDDPPPFDENNDFDFGLDNKVIRRAFIRKVRRPSDKIIYIQWQIMLSICLIRPPYILPILQKPSI